MVQSENDLYTRVGPGTPCGEMLRRYWWPVALSEQAGDSPVPVRLLGEDLVLFRDGGGAPGLLERRCAHRGASLEFGRVEEKGLRCCYHGWLYDTEGRCLDQPCEPKDSTYRNQVRQKAFPARDVSGFVFAYLGPDPVPAFPKYDLLFQNCDKVVMGRDMHSNWLQRAENMLDALHVMCLHAPLYPELALKRPDKVDWIERWYGFEMELEYPNGTRDRHHHVFPSANRVEILRAGQEPHQFMQWCVPIDDTRSVAWQIWAGPPRQGPCTLTSAKYQATVAGEYKRVKDGWWNIWERDQDDAAVDSQGRITDRSREHLATSDLGIVKFRRMIGQAIEAVSKGEDPAGVVRAGDGHDGLIDLQAYKTELGATPGQIRRPEIGKRLEVIAPYDL
jgi:5,5'-dehydrodivanillate O-demethylase